MQIAKGEELLSNLNELLHGEMERIKEEQNDLEEEKRKFQEQKEKLEKMYTIPENVIELNVGGTKITTYKSTLCKHKDSLLAAMFSGRHPMTKDQKGRYFIDRNPEMFQLILELLRTDHLPPVDEAMKPLLRRELDFFGLEQLETNVIHLTNVKEKKGVFHYLGQTKEKWVNPTSLHLVSISMSTSAGSNPNSLADPTNTSFIENTWGKEGTPWILFSLHCFTLNPTGYMIAHSGNRTHFLRNWVFEGSTDKVEWKILRTHADDLSLDKDKLEAVWEVERSPEKFSHFRVTLTGPSAAGKNNFSLTRVELFGKLFETR